MVQIGFPDLPIVNRMLSIMQAGREQIIKSKLLHIMEAVAITEAMFTLTVIAERILAM